MSSARSIAAIASLPQISFCLGEPTGRSFSMDVRLSNELPPFGVVFADEARKFGRRAGDDLDALRREPRFQFRGVEDPNDFRIHFRDDVRRNPGRHEQPKPWIEDITWHAGFGEGRYVAQVREARGRRAAEEPQLAVLDMRQEGIRRADPHLDAPRKQIGNCRGCSLVRHMVHPDAGEHLEQRRGKVLRAAVAGGAEVQLAGAQACIGDQLLHRSGGHRWRHDQQELDARHLANRGEVGERVEGRLAQVRVDRKDVVGGEQPSVAVGGALCDQIGADILAAAGPVLDHHRLGPDVLQPGGDRARDGVGRAPGRKRHDDPDRALGKALRCSNRGGYGKRCKDNPSREHCRSPLPIVPSSSLPRAGCCARMIPRLNRGETMLIHLYCSIAAALLCPALPAWAQKDMADGSGKALVDAQCNSCHALTARTGSGYTPEDWKTVMRMMTNHGVSIAPAQLGPMTDYLAKTFPVTGRPAAVLVPGPVKVSMRAWQAATPGSRPHDPLAARDGALWYTVQNANRIGRLDPKNAEIKLLTPPTPKSRPYGMALDSRGNLFVVQFGTNKVARVDPKTLEIREFTLPDPASRPRRLAITRDDMIWYSDYSRGYLGRLDPATGKVTEWQSPSGPKSAPYGISVINDVIWYSESESAPNTVVRFDPKTEKFQSWAIPGGGNIVRNTDVTRDGDFVLANSLVNEVTLVRIAK